MPNFMNNFMNGVCNSTGVNDTPYTTPYIHVPHHLSGPEFKNPPMGSTCGHTPSWMKNFENYK